MSNASRIGPLANLPVFFKLDGKRVVLVGGGEPALWKTELLAATGASVDVVSERFTDGFRALAASPPESRVVLVERRWSKEDLVGAALAVGSFADEGEAASFAAAARAAGVPVNVVDRPQFCDFQFGAIVNRSPLIVGISTDGAVPVFGQAVRSLIEGMLPEGFRLWAEAARDLRRDGDRLGDTPGRKRRFWQRFTDFAIRNSDRSPTAGDLDRLVAGEAGASMVGQVAVIDVDRSPDTLTLAAIRALRSADDIYFDDCIPPAILDFGRREARRHGVSGAQAKFEQIQKLLVDAARAGRSVARLRLRPTSGHESEGEVDALRDAGLKVVFLAAGTAV